MPTLDGITYRPLTVKQRVANGARFFDLVAPGWWRESRINLDTLDLMNEHTCICGQGFGGLDNQKWRRRAAEKVKSHWIGGWYARSGFAWATDLFHEGGAWIEARIDINGDTPSATEIARRLGFQSTTRKEVAQGISRGNPASYLSLQNEWKRVIKARREADKANRKARPKVKVDA